MVVLSVLYSFLIYLQSCFAAVSAAVDDFCPSTYQPCSPPGASAGQLPFIGPALGSLYIELLYTVKMQSTESTLVNNSSSVRGRDAAATVCCAPGTKCMLLQNFNLPFCWDRFTTDYFLPNGAYGTIDNGSYTSSSGEHANLITGEYQLPNGQSGNIYHLNDPAQPNTSTLPMPSPFTSSGIGSAIPASQLGGTAHTPTPTLTSVVSTTKANTTITKTTSLGSVYGGRNTSTISLYSSSGVHQPSTTTATTSSASTSQAATNEAFSIMECCYWQIYLLRYLTGFCTLALFGLLSIWH